MHGQRDVVDVRGFMPPPQQQGRRVSKSAMLFRKPASTPRCSVMSALQQSGTHASQPHVGRVATDFDRLDVSTSARRNGRMRSSTAFTPSLVSSSRSLCQGCEQRVCQDAAPGFQNVRRVFDEGVPRRAERLRHIPQGCEINAAGGISASSGSAQRGWWRVCASPVFRRLLESPGRRVQRSLNERRFRRR